MRASRLIGGFFVLTVLLAGPRAAGATPLELHAHTVLTGLTDFSVFFNDTGDGLLQFSEITSFTGFTASPPAIAVPMTETSIIAVPDIPGFATTNCTASIPGCTPFLWFFGPGPLIAGQT